MKKMANIILAFLGIPEFQKKDGKATLTDDQRAKVKATFGEDFTAKFANYLASAEDDDGDGDQMASLIASLTTAQQSNNAALEARLQGKIDDLVTKNTELQQTVTTLADSQEEDLVPEMDTTIPRRAETPAIMNVDMRRPHYNAVGHFLKNGHMGGVEAATIDVADLATEFGTYLSQNQNNLQEVKALFQGFTSAPLFTSQMAVTEWRAWQSLITSISQQFTNKWTPSGKTKFRPLVVKNRRHKINFPIIPSEVLESYILFMYDEGLAPDQMPITKYIWNQLIYPQLMQDIELRMIFKGKYVEKAWNTVSTGDAGGSPEDSMDGVETILVDGKASGDTGIRYFDTPILDFQSATDDQILKYVADFVDWIAPLFRTKNMPIGCSEEFYRRYKRAYKNKWGAGSDKSDQTQFGSDTIDFSRQYLKVIDGMYSSPILFATPKENLIKLRHKNEVPRVINDVQKVDYEVRTFGEYWLGVGFAYGEAVFASVPDGYNPKSVIANYYGGHTEYQQNRGIYVPAGSGSGSSGGGL